MKWVFLYISLISVELSFGQLIFNENDSIDYDKIDLSTIDKLDYNLLDTINGGISITYLDGGTETRYWKTIRVFGKGYVFHFDNDNNFNSFEFSYLLIDKSNKTALKHVDWNVGDVISIQTLLDKGFKHEQINNKYDAFINENLKIMVRPIKSNQTRVNRKIKRIELTLPNKS